MQSNRQLHHEKNIFMRLLIGCLLCCCSVSAQITDSSIVKPVDLPATEPFDSSRTWQRVSSPYIYIISDNDIYNYFGNMTSMKFREFNFGHYHILGEFKCRQCMQFCHHKEGQTKCHRNRCNKEWIWVMRENEKAFTEIPVSASPGYTGIAMPAGRHSFLRDTVIKAVSDTVKATWYTTGHGDCFAHFKYGLFADKYHPVLLLKEWNYWGGCRAGGSRDYTLSFSMYPGVLYTIKNTVLMDKYGKPD